MADATTIRQVFARVCQDSGFRLHFIQAARLAAGMLHISPLEVWLAVGDFSIMERIAKGEVRPTPPEAQ